MREGLRRYRAHWDPARAASGRAYAYGDEEVLIATDFECGNGMEIRRVEKGAYALDLEPEPGAHVFSGQSYYFCFGVRNRQRAPRRITVALRNRGAPQWYDQTRHVVTRRGERWGQLPRRAIRPFPNEERLVLDLDLPAGDAEEPVIFYSNFHWYPYTDLVRDLAALARACPALRRSTAGRSHLGRELPRLEVGPRDPDAPTIVIAQTPQPSEAGQWACRAVLEWLLSNDPGAVAVRARHRVIALPNTNPDGTVLGFGVSDGQGRFPFFEADLAAEERPEATPETRAVWRCLAAARPWLFIEWHSNNWSRRPGHMLLRYEHSLLRDARLRRLWDRWEEHLLGLSETYHGNWTGPARGLYRSSMGYQAVTRLQAVACMIKHHDRFDMPDMRNHAVACFRAAAEAYDEIMVGATGP